MANQHLETPPVLLNAQGRGVKNGVPYGEQILIEEDALHQQYALDPAKERALRAQTRKALGR